MPSITTVCRAIVMIAVGAIIFKVWKLYGPSADEVKKAVVSAVDSAEAAWKNWQSPEEKSQATAGTTKSAPAAPAAAQLSVEPAAPVAPPLAQASGSGTHSDSANAASPAKLEPITPVDSVAPTSPTNAKDLPELISRLEKMGVTDRKLTTWGSSGRLWRCSCNAPIGNAAGVTQHFESVAENDAMAVKQVVAKVEAWRTARLSGSTLR
jgi:hypothetical protein